MTTIRVRQRHVYVPDPALPADHRGDQPCLCGAAKSNERHELPPTPPDAKRAEARRYGGDP